uniref:Uncharacterized protein n=1 Tax=Acrobeloides nanus TaxID=290746 RepID=A0A914DLP4_9BILA
MRRASAEDIKLEKLLYNIVDFTSMKFYKNVFVMALIYDEHNMYSAASTKTYFHDFIAGMENFEDHMDGCYMTLTLTERKMNFTVFYIAKPQYNNKLNFSPQLMVQAKGLNFSDCDKDIEWMGLILNTEGTSPHAVKRNTRYLTQNTLVYSVVVLS